MTGERHSSAWGRRRLDRSLGRSLVFLAIAVAVCGPAIGMHWLFLAYALGAGAGLYAGLRLLRGGADRGPGFLVDLVAGLDVRPLMTVVVAWTGWGLAVSVAKSFAETIERFGDEAVSVAEFGNAWTAAVKAGFSFDAPLFLVPMGLAVGTAALSGLIDGVWVGRVSAGTGKRPWQVLPGGRAWSGWRRKERERCRRWLRGESGAAE